MDTRDTQEMARMGGLARAQNLTPQERKDQGRHAASKRWEKHVGRGDHCGYFLVDGMLFVWTGGELRDPEKPPTHRAAYEVRSLPGAFVGAGPTARAAAEDLESRIAPRLRDRTFPRGWYETEVRGFTKEERLLYGEGAAVASARWYDDTYDQRNGVQGSPS